MPSCRLMSRIAVTTPNHEPVYFANWGLEAWKRILTRSRGATTVLACGKIRMGTDRVGDYDVYVQHILPVLLRVLSSGHNLGFVCSSVSGSQPTWLLSVFRPEE